MRTKWVTVIGFPSYELSDRGEVRLATGSKLPVEPLFGTVWLYKHAKVRRAIALNLAVMIDRHKGKFV